MALRCKRVDITEIYPICNDNIEDVSHILVKCSFARRVWCRTGVGDRSGLADMFENWWHQILQNQTKENINLAAMITWCLWNNRNEVVWNGKCRPYEWIQKTAKEVLGQWQQAKRSQIVQQQRSGADIAGRWTRPEPG